MPDGASLSPVRRAIKSIRNSTAHTYIMPTKLYKKTNPHTNGFPEIGYDAMGDDDCYAGWHDAMPQIDMVKKAATPRNFFGAMSSRSILEIGEWYQWKDPKFKRLTLEEVWDMTSWFQRHYDLH